MSRRSYGSGRLYAWSDANGRENWYGRWRVGQRRRNQRLGRKRSPGERDGLTRAQAERELQRRIDADRGLPSVSAITVEQAGERLIAHLESLGRKRSTLGDYRSYLRVHLEPFFGRTALGEINPGDVERFIARKRAEGKAAKSIFNYLSLLHSIFAYSQRRDLVLSNPVAQVDKPRRDGADPNIRYLDDDELDALIAAVPEDSRGATERVLYLAAAMTGLRQGELLALRWRDVDFAAARVRVRQSYVRGEMGTPKSRRGARSVPLAAEVAAQLSLHRAGSHYDGEDDLVFSHPESGGPLDRSRLLKRFKAAVTRAGVGQFEELLDKNGKPRRRALTRFHDLRHTFGTRMAAAGVPLRTIQEWMGHRDFKTTLIYADYQPNEHEAELVERAFRRRSRQIRLDGVR